MPLKLNNLGMYLFPLNNKDIEGLQGNRVFPAIYNILYLVRADISLIYIVIKSLFKYFNIRYVRVRETLRHLRQEKKS